MTELRVLETPLLRGLLGFVEALRAEGLSPGQDQVQAWLQGLLSVPWEGGSFYLASRALLVGRKEDYTAFDRAFRRYFGWLRPEFLPQQKALGSLPLLGQAEAEGEGALRGAYSPLERLLKRPLESLTPGEALVLARFLLALAFPRLGTPPEGGAGPGRGKGSLYPPPCAGPSGREGRSWTLAS